MLTITTCRKLLGTSGDGLSDEEIERKRDQYYAVAYMLFDLWRNTQKKKPRLITVSFEMRYSISFAPVGQ